MILRRNRTVLGGVLLTVILIGSVGCSTGQRMDGPIAVTGSQPTAARTATIEVLGLVCPT